MHEALPSRMLLWRGSLLGSIAHAVFVARAPLLANSQSWDGRNYSVQDSAGSRGTISFGEDSSRFVAVFYFLASRRNPLRREVDDPRKAIYLLRQRLLHGIPSKLIELSQEALLFVLQKVEDESVPVITSAFWSDIGSPLVTAAESWSDVVDHGAFLMKREMMAEDLAMQEWTREFEFDSVEISVTGALFKRRLAVAGAVELMPEEVRQLRSRSRGERGLQACLEALAQIGIVWPPGLNPSTRNPD